MKIYTLKDRSPLSVILLAITLIFTTSSIAQKSIKDLKIQLLEVTPDSEEQMEALFNLGEAFFTINEIDSLKKYSNTLDKIALKTDNNLYIHLSQKLKAKALYKEGYYEQSIPVFKAILNPLIEEKDFVNLVDTSVYLATSNNITSNHSEALENLKVAEQYSTEELLPPIYNAYAQTYIEFDELDKALNYLNKSIEIGLKYNLDFELAIANQTYANVNLKLENYDKAITYFKRAQTYYEKLNDTRGLFLVYNNTALSLVSLGKHKEGKTYYEKAYTLSLKFNNEYATAALLSNIAMEEAYDKKYEKAIRMLKESNVVFEKLQVNDGLCENLRNLGAIYQKTNNLPQAQSYTIKAKEFAAENEYTKYELDATEQLISIYKSRGKYKEALAASEEASALKELIFSEKKIKEQEGQKALFEVRQKEQDLLLQEQEITALKDREKLSRYIYVLLGIGLLLMLALLFRQLSLAKAKRKVLEVVNKLNALKQEQLQQRVDQKSGQVVNFALHIREKNELLEELKEKITGVKKSAGDQTTKKNLQDILFSINNYININQNRVQLISEVKESNEEFLTELGARYPELTDREKNIAGLIRLNMSSKQISENLNLTEMSLNNIRSRIRKKINVPKGSNLNEFLKEFKIKNPA